MRARLTLLGLMVYFFPVNLAFAQSSLPSGWSHTDIGTIGVAGSASYSNGVFTVSAAGPQIWGSVDGMHFVYQPMAGNGSIVARVVSVTGMRSGTNPVLGVMVRETLASNSRHVSSVYRTNPIVELMWRGATGGSTSYTNSSIATPLPYWLKVVRSGSTISSYMSPDGVSWTQVGATQTLTFLATNVYIGLAVSSEDTNNNSLVTATFDNVSVGAAPWAPAAAPWLDQDLGSVGVPGNASYLNGLFTVSAAGPQIGGTSDGMHFVYQPLSGDGSIVARVLGVQGVQSGTNPVVGVMIRETLSPSSTNASSAWRNNPLVELVWRAVTGGSSSYVNSAGLAPPPYWVKVARSGSLFSAFMSSDGVTWTQVGASQTISMATNAYIGLAVSSQNSNNNSLVTATFDNVSVSSTAAPAPTISSIWPTRGIPGYDVSISGSGFGNSQGSSVALLNGTPLTINSWGATSIVATIPAGATSGPVAVFVAPTMDGSNPATFEVLPAGWLDQDVGSIGVAGNASYGNGIFTVSAAGPQIWGTSDGMHFVYAPMTGDGSIVARVVSVSGANSGTNPIVGVMIRETLNPTSTHVSSVYRTGPLVELIWRSVTGGSTSFVNSSISTTLPYWVKVTRSGSAFSAFLSSNGTSWTQVGSTQTITMAANAYVGLAVSSEDPNNNSLVTATFDNVSITPVAAQPPVITDINPFSGPVGTTVTVLGANFGPQGASTVAFNGVAAGPGVWTPTAIAVPVPYGATAGNIVVKANGMNSNGVPFTVIPAPNIISLSPTSGPVGTPVTITGTNFGFSQGSSAVAFAGVPAPTVTSWSQTSIVVNVPYGAVTGGVVVTVAGVPGNVASFTVTSTSPTIAGLSPASGPAGTSVTINGTNFGTSTGTVTFACGGFRCRRASAAVATWTPTSIVVTVPTAAATGAVLVYANNVSSNPAIFTLYTVQSGAATLTVNPGNLNMVIGQTQPIQLLDQNGSPFSSPSWAIANPSVASIVPPVNQGDPTLLQATAIGNTTLTGMTADGRTGSAQIAILSGTSLPIGTVQWEVPSLGTTGIASIVQSLRIDNTTPDFYVLDWGANGGSGAFRALTADGQQKWMFTPSAPSNEELALLAADDQGGFIFQRDDWSDFLMLGRVDENGNQSWLMSTPHGIASNVAIHPDGTVYIVQPDYLNTGNSPTAVVALDEITGQLKFALPIPTGTYTGTDYTFLNDPNGGSGGDGYPAIGGQYCTPGTSTAAASSVTVGNLSISSDGTVYLPIGTGAFSYDAMPCDSSPDPSHPGYPHLVKSTDGVSSLTSYLQVMEIQSNGTYTLRQLDTASWSHSGNSPGGGSLGNLGNFSTATPDGNGGTLLAIDNSGLSPSVPSAFYHDTGSAVTKLSLAFNPVGEILTGEDGTAYLAGPNPSPSTSGAIAAINIGSNAIAWTDTTSSGSPLLLAVPGTGGVIFKDNSGHLNVIDPNGVISPLFPGRNGIDQGPTSASFATFRNPGTWLVFQSDRGLAALTGNYMNLTGTDRPMVNGDPQGQSAPSKGDLELVWCANNGCSDLGNNYTQDVTFYTQQQGPPLTSINFTPAQQQILTNAAWTAFKQAFSAYNVNVGMGGSGLTPTHTAYIVGTISTNNSSCALTDGNKVSWSWVFYQANMGYAQTAISITTPTPTQAQLNRLAQAIGEGIGNNAAHEIAHELVNEYNPIPGKIVNRMDLDDTSLDTYNEGDCTGSKSPWVYLGVGNDGVHPGQTPIHWSPNADQSLANIYGRRTP